jgi:hypothetical protein
LYQGKSGNHGQDLFFYRWAFPRFLSCSPNR